MPDLDPYRTAFESITAMGTLAAGLIKPLVDAIKFAFPKLPKSATPGIAVLAGIVVLSLVTVAGSVPFSLALCAQIVLASVVGSLVAIGINGLHDKADEAKAVEERKGDRSSTTTHSDLSDANTSVHSSTRSIKQKNSHLSNIEWRR